MASIKISELISLDQITSDDFFPLVDSASMTTRRVSSDKIKDFVSTGSFSGSFYGKLIPMPTQLSASWASQSLSSSHALVANKLNVSYTNNTIAFWDPTKSSNSYLNPGQVGFSYISESNAVLLGINDYGVRTKDWVDSGSMWYSGRTQFFGGFQSNLPMLCDNFISYARSWLICTGSVWPSGSYYVGANHTIGTAPGSVSSSLNNKWIRILATNKATGSNPAGARSKEYVTGTIKIVAQTESGWDGYGEKSNVQDVCIFDVNIAPYGGPSNVFVRQPIVPYNQGLIKYIRVGTANQYNGLQPYYDPATYIDLMLSGIYEGDRYVELDVTTYGPLKCVSIPTLDTAPLRDTGSNSPPFTHFIFDPTKAGYHTNASSVFKRDFTISGANLGIGPYSYYATASNYPKYTLDVSGSIHGSNYNVNNIPGGTSGSIIVYQNVDGGRWLNLSFVGGILTAAPSASVSANQNVQIAQGSFVPVGTIIDWAGNLASTYATTVMGIGTYWLLCTGSSVLASSFPDLASVLGTGTGGVWGSTTVGYIKLPDLRKKATYGSSPGGSDTNISASVGGSGGSEDLKHYHFIGNARGNPSTNDDIHLIAGNNSMTEYKPFSSSLFNSGTNNRKFFVQGDSAAWTQTAEGYWGVGDKLYFVTTMGVSDETRGQSMPPNAIVHKLIKAK